MDPFAQYLSTNRRLDVLIDLEPAHAGGPEAIRARAIQRFEWMQSFAAFLGNPEAAAPVVHVTGTSGKGSTAAAIASILEQAGKRTLLHTSPYLQVSTEKIQVGGRLVSAADLDDLATDVIDAAGRFGQGRLTYGEAWIAMVLLAMARFRPDVAVIEVGAGGRYDLSNVVRPDVAVITTVGIDHTESLGETIGEIAWHKAGIIKSGAHVVHSVAQQEAVRIVEAEAGVVGAASMLHVRESDLTRTATESGSSGWIDPRSGRSLVNGIPGNAQVVNGAVAAAAARAFDSALPDRAVVAGLAAARIPARFERMPSATTVILDGAHNEQKIAAMIRDLQLLPRPRVAVVGFLASKRFESMIRQLTPELDALIVSAPAVVGKAAVAPDRAEGIARSLTEIPVSSTSSTAEAVEMAMTQAGSGGSVIVTGSLYLTGQARERWYPGAEIVRQQTQWPESWPSGHQMS